jgi:hypothetical protein
MSVFPHCGVARSHGPEGAEVSEQGVKPSPVLSPVKDQESRRLECLSNLRRDDGCAFRDRETSNRNAQRHRSSVDNHWVRASQGLLDDGAYGCVIAILEREIDFAFVALEVDP